MYWYTKILVGYGFSCFSLGFFYTLKLIFDYHPFYKRISPLIKKYYYIDSRYFKGVAKFIKKEKDLKGNDNFIFKNLSFQIESDNGNDKDLRSFKQKDIIREANREELKEVLIDEL